MKFRVGVISGDGIGPEIVKQLSKEISDYLRARNAQRPSIKATGKVIPYPDEL